jgi:hypothetical protein
MTSGPRVNHIGYEYDSPGCTSLNSIENSGCVIIGNTCHAMKSPAIDMTPLV